MASIRRVPKFRTVRPDLYCLGSKKAVQNKNAGRKKPQKTIPLELKQEILRIALAVQGPGQTVSGLIQQIDRRLGLPKSQVTAIKRTLEEAAAEGGFKLPAKTNSRGKHGQ